MKKFLVSAVSFIIGTALAVTGALAYVNADIQLLNGNSGVANPADIIQLSYQRTASAKNCEHTWGSYNLVGISDQGLLAPTNYTGTEDQAVITNAPGVKDKFVFVKNIGSSPVYIRTYIAFEAGDLTATQFSNTVGYKINRNGYYDWDESLHEIQYQNERYFVITATSVAPLTVDAISEPSLLQFYITENTNEAFCALVGEDYKVLVASDSNTERIFTDDYAAVFSSISQ